MPTSFLFAEAIGVFIDVDGDIRVFLKDAARHVFGDRALRKRVDIVRLEAFLTKANEARRARENNSLNRGLRIKLFSCNQIIARKACFESVDRAKANLGNGKI